MSIPKMNSCCCGCTLRTGTKIIGWFNLVSAILALIIMGISLADVYNIEEHTEIKTPKAEMIRKNLPALKAMMLLAIALCVIVVGVTFILLKGVYENKAKYVYFWIVVTLTFTALSILGQLAKCLILNSWELVLGTVIGLLIQLYFIWVVYSFYCEIKNTPNNSA